MIRLLIWVLEILAGLLLIRFLWRMLLGQVTRVSGVPPSRAGRPFQGGDPVRTEPRAVAGELKKDPQCGTYISTELSIKTRYRGEVLHFCSRECEQKFLQTHSEKSA